MAPPAPQSHDESGGGSTDLEDTGRLAHVRGPLPSHSALQRLRHLHQSKAASTPVCRAGGRRCPARWGTHWSQPREPGGSGRDVQLPWAVDMGPGPVGHQRPLPSATALRPGSGHIAPAHKYMGVWALSSGDLAPHIPPLHPPATGPLPNAWALAADEVAPGERMSCTRREGRLGLWPVCGAPAPLRLPHARLCPPVPGARPPNPAHAS